MTAPALIRKADVARMVADWYEKHGPTKYPLKWASVWIGGT